MVAAVINKWTLIDYAKSLLHDASGAFFDDTDVQYTRRLLEKVYQPSTTFNFQWVSTGYYKYFPEKIYLWNPSFSGLDGLTYTLNATGSIVVTAGTETRTDFIPVTGAAVDFPEFMVDLCMFISGQRSMEGKSVV